MSRYLPISHATPPLEVRDAPPHISPYLPISPYILRHSDARGARDISPYLPISPHIFSYLRPLCGARDGRCICPYLPISHHIPRRSAAPGERYISPYLPISPHISPCFTPLHCSTRERHLPISPHTSPYLFISLATLLRLGFITSVIIIWVRWVSRRGMSIVRSDYDNECIGERTQRCRGEGRTRLLILLEQAHIASREGGALLLTPHPPPSMW